MKLVGLDVSGFKLYGQKQSFTFGMVNEIMGDRGKGKTALCEAIIWCLKGCDMKGNSRGILKHLKNEFTKEMTVVTRWDFPSPDGGIARHELSRMSKGRSMRLLIDGEQVDQAAFDSFFGPTDVFLSVFLPTYFGGLAAAKARDVLLALLPAVDDHAVIASLSDKDRIHIGSCDMTDPLRCMRELQYELKEWNEYIRDVESRISTIRMAESINGGNFFASEDDCKLKAMKAQMEQLLQMNPPAPPKHILEWEEERMVMGKQYRELVTKWNEVKNKTMPGLNPQMEKAERLLHLDSIASKCQTLLEQGFALRDQIERERKHHEQDVADFETHQQNEIQQLRGHIQRLEDKQSFRRQHAQHAERLPKMEERLKDGNEERHRVLAAIESVQNFLLRYAALQVEEANQVLHHAEILLTTKRETEGSVTLQYRLLYDKKVYYSLSSSEKISCSFELSKLAALQGKGRIPVFIDGEESKETFMASQIQYFVTTRIPDAALSYEVVVA